MNGHHAPLPLDATIVDLFDEWAAKTPDRIAAEWQGETLTYSRLRIASLHVSRALLSAGVSQHARVPLLTDMSLEMLPAIIGILRVGACYAPMDVMAWSRERIEGALSNLSSPVAVVTTACPGIQLPVITVNFQKAWLYSSLENTSNLYAHLNARRHGMRDDDLAWILFTSGTTGKPKGVMVYHSAAHAYALLEILERCEDITGTEKEGIRNLLAFSVGFDGCASVVWTTLTKGHTLVLASATNFPEVAATCDVLMLTPSMWAILDPSGPYDRVRYIFLGAEDPSMDIVRQWSRPGRKVFTTYGPTEATCIITLGELKLDEEITLGELLPGVVAVLVDENLQECGNHGELLIGGPGLAAGYINNPELTAKRFIRWNGERFYRTGDLVRRTDKDRLVWGGRADSMVKNRGFFINLESEVEPALLSFPSVRLGVALKWRDKLIGYVQPSTVDIEQLRGYLKGRFDSFIIPDEIFALDTFPLNVNGKVDRKALAAQREKRMTQAEDILLQNGHVSAYDALRLAFSTCLHVVIGELDKESSFLRLGGNSFTAIRLSNFLKKRGYFISAVQVLRLDTIETLEGNLKSLTVLNGTEQGENGSHPNGVEGAPATDAQKTFLTRSLHDPLLPALIGMTKYVGNPPCTPTADELHDAFVKALSAHSIFQTRFDLENFALFDLGRLNLVWNDVSVEEVDFDNACAAAEQKAWLDMKAVTRADTEVPYFHITCVSVPDRKALAFIMRAHHVLLDVVSQAIISRDVDRALAGEEIPKSPRIEDFARFMHGHKRENLARAISTFANMMEPLPATSLLKLPAPQTPPLEQDLDLIRFDISTSTRKSTLDASAGAKRVTSSTMVYAAWALFLHSITTWDQVGFRISLSGRTVPWPYAQSVVGCLVDGAPFSIAVPTDLTVHKWLAQVHKTNLDVLEFDGLALSLPESLRADPRCNKTNVLCFLDMPQPSTANWRYTEKQRHNYLMDWYVFEEGEHVMTWFEVQARQVDSDWAKDKARLPALMLEGLVNAAEDTLVGDLLAG